MRTNAFLMKMNAFECFQCFPRPSPPISLTPLQTIPTMPRILPTKSLHKKTLNLYRDAYCQVRPSSLASRRGPWLPNSATCKQEAGFEKLHWAPIVGRLWRPVIGACASRRSQAPPWPIFNYLIFLFLFLSKCCTRALKKGLRSSLFCFRWAEVRKRLF